MPSGPFLSFLQTHAFVFQIVQLLLRSGVDVTLRNYEGQTALEVASPQLQQLLLDAVDKGEPHRNLLQAAWQGNACLVKKILVSHVNTMFRRRGTKRSSFMEVCWCRRRRSQC